MSNEKFISAIEFCKYHHIEVTFIESLNSYGLVRITTESDELLIPSEEIDRLERLVHLHFELEINLEGIEAINFMLERVESMQSEISSLRNRLRFYEHQPE